MEHTLCIFTHYRLLHAAILRKMVYLYVSPLLKSNGRVGVLVLIIRICYLCTVVAIIYFFSRKSDL